MKKNHSARPKALAFFSMLATVLFSLMVLSLMGGVSGQPLASAVHVEILEPSNQTIYFGKTYQIGVINTSLPGAHFRLSLPDNAEDLTWHIADPSLSLALAPVLDPTFAAGITDSNGRRHYTGRFKHEPQPELDGPGTNLADPGLRGFTAALAFRSGASFFSFYISGLFQEQVLWDLELRDPFGHGNPFEFQVGFRQTLEYALRITNYDAFESLIIPSSVPFPGVVRDTIEPFGVETTIPIAWVPDPDGQDPIGVIQVFPNSFTELPLVIDIDSFASPGIYQTTVDVTPRNGSRSTVFLNGEFLGDLSFDDIEVVLTQPEVSPPIGHDGVYTMQSPITESVVNFDFQLANQGSFDWEVVQYDACLFPSMPCGPDGIQFNYSNPPTGLLAPGSFMIVSGELTLPSDVDDGPFFLTLGVTMRDQSQNEGMFIFVIEGSIDLDQTDDCGEPGNPPCPRLLVIAKSLTPLNPHALVAIADAGSPLLNQVNNPPEPFDRIVELSSADGFLEFTKRIDGAGAAYRLAFFNEVADTPLFLERLEVTSTNGEGDSYCLSLQGPGGPGCELDVPIDTGADLRHFDPVNFTPAQANGPSNVNAYLEFIQNVELGITYTGLLEVFPPGDPNTFRQVRLAGELEEADDQPDVVVYALDRDQRPVDTIAPGDLFFFQDISVGNGHLQRFAIANLGSTDVIISNLLLDFCSVVNVGGDFELVQSFGGTLAPGQRGIFKVRLTASAERGFDKKVSFDYRAPGSPEQTYEFCVTGESKPTNEKVYTDEIPDDLLNDIGLDIPPPPPGSNQSSLDFYIENVGQGGNLNGNIDPNVGDGFSVSPTSFSIPPGDVFTFTTTVTANAPGTYSGVLSIHSDDPVWSTFTVLLRAVVDQPPPVNGVLYVTLDDETPVFHDSVLSFGSTELGSPVTKTLWLWNFGFDPLVFVQADFEIPPGYRLVSFPTNPIPPWVPPSPPSRGTMKVRLKANAPGDHNGDLLINNDEGYVPNPYVIHLMGTVSSDEVNNAVVVRHTLPHALLCGATYQASVTMRNRGTTTWFRDGAFGYKLGMNGDGDPFHQGRVPLPHGVTVAPNQTHRFEFDMTAPMQPDVYFSDWRMYKRVQGPGDEWFGQVAARSITVSCTDLNDARVVGHTLPTTLGCGATYQASVTMRNTGTTTWTRNGNLGHELGMNGNGDPFHTGRIRLPQGVAVPPGQTHTFDISMTAPTEPDTYLSDWRMVDDVQGAGDEWFGEVAAQSIQVTCQDVNDAEVVDHTLPASMACGASSQATVTMRNTGTTSWTRSGNLGYKLGMNGDGDPFHNGRIRLPHGANVAPGQTHTFVISMTAPQDPDTYLSDWRMIHDLQGSGSDEWFGDVAERMIDVSCNPANDAEVVAHTLPASLAAGATYQATVTMRNTGTTTWTRNGNLGYKLGMNGDGDPFHQGRIRLPNGVSVAPGQTHTFSISMQAPAEPGDYVSDWRMYHQVQGSGDEWFGQVALQVVNVY